MQVFSPSTFRLSDPDKRKLLMVNVLSHVVSRTVPTDRPCGTYRDDGIHRGDTW